MTPDQKPHIGELLKRHRQSLRPRISQEYLARQIAMSTVWVQKVEQGVNAPSERALFAYGRAVGINDQEILNMIENSTYPSEATVNKAFHLTYGDNRRLRRLAATSGINEQELIRRFVKEGLDMETNQT